MTLEDFLRTEAMKCSVKNAEQVQRAWQAATAAERERCAKIADDYGRDPDLHKTYPCETADEIAASIRAGEEPK